MRVKEQNQHLPFQRCLQGEEIRCLSDTELLALLLGSGTRNIDIMSLALASMENFGGLPGISRSGVRELAKEPGIGMKKAVRILAAFEAGRRALTDPKKLTKISSPEAVWKLVLPSMAGLITEEFRVLILNNRQNLLKNNLISMGSVSEAIVHPREVFRDAIKEGASAIIICHNHPSGSLEPSREDIVTTERIAESGRVVGIPLVDHVIVAASGYLSLKEAGYL